MKQTHDEVEIDLNIRVFCDKLMGVSTNYKIWQYLFGCQGLSHEKNRKSTEMVPLILYSTVDMRWLISTYYIEILEIR